MTELLLVVLPVFLVIGFGYVVTRAGMLGEAAVDGLMLFAQKFAIPCLLFLAIARLDLGQSFNVALLGSFYGGALLCFVVGIAGARWLFDRPWPDAVAIGFACLFSNSVLLGLPIMERAFGTAALAPNYAIVAVHAPIAYGLGILVMEIVQARGDSPLMVSRKVLRAMFSNTLIIGIGLGFVVNLGQITVPVPVIDALELMARAALPAALFGLGGVLHRYKPEGDTKTVVFMCVVSLILHPCLVWLFGGFAQLSTGELRSAIVTSSMPPGINAYIFASMYGVAMRVSATTVLFGTAAAVVTAWAWLAVLP